MNTGMLAKSEPLEATEFKRREKEPDYSQNAHGWRVVEQVCDDVALVELGPPSTRLVALKLLPSASARLAGLVATERVLTASAAIADKLDSLGLRPDRVVKSSGGGIIFYFFASGLMSDGSHKRYASIEADEDGELTALYRDRVLSSTEVVDILDEPSLGEAIRRIASSLKG